MSVNVIAIDGPAGAGKSTIAKILAAELGYLYIDTGAMYRTVALFAIREGIVFDDDPALKELCERLNIRLQDTDGEYRVFCNDEEVTQAIRTPDVSAAASPVSAAYPVRIAMVEQQRKMAKHGNVIMDGRDIGTNVFPFAGCKIFLTASLSERARRRTLELIDKGFNTTEEEVKSGLEERDYRDSHRSFAPLSRAADAMEVDSTSLSIEQVVELVKNSVLNKCSDK